MDICLCYTQAGHGFDLRLDILLHLLCHFTNVMAKQRQKSDFDFYGIILTNFDPHTLGKPDNFWYTI